MKLVVTKARKQIGDSIPLFYTEFNDGNLKKIK